MRRSFIAVAVLGAIACVEAQPPAQPSAAVPPEKATAAAQPSPQKAPPVQPAAQPPEKPCQIVLAVSGMS